ncbi:MAG: sulfite exporter TauE/SafE family protein [Solirubrobacteraceae bacterium]
MSDPSLLQLVFLAGAALLAGAINAIAGGGSLISFPALLAVGYPSVAANVTNLIALVPGYAGGTAAYREQLRGQGGRVRALGATSAVGAAAGTALLLNTSSSAFDAVVPGLVLLACLLLAVQPVLTRAIAGRAGGRADVALHVLVFAASIYGGYFGAGLGIMLLAVLAAALAEDLQRLNALKGALSLVVAVVSGVAVGLFGPVAWVPAAVMAAASVVGGVAGARIAQKLPAGVLRWGVVAYGVVLAVVLAAR